MPKFMLVAADAAKARVFHRDEKYSPLVEVETLVHPEARLRKQDLESDRHGKVFESAGHGESDNQPPTDAKQKELQRFTHELAAYLRKACLNGKLKGLTLVAEPTVLGQLRKTLDPEVRQLITKEVSKNITTKTPAEIAKLVDNMD